MLKLLTSAPFLISYINLIRVSASPVAQQDATPAAVSSYRLSPTLSPQNDYNLTTSNTTVFGPANIQDCHHPPPGVAVFRKTNEDYAIGVDITGWWFSNYLCIEAFDYSDPATVVGEFYTNRFSNDGRRTGIEIDSPNYDNFLVTVTACPPRIGKFVITFTGRSHGTNYRRTEAINEQGGFATSASCRRDLGPQYSTDPDQLTTGGNGTSV